MHTNHTTNYELSQFVATDKPTFLGDYNGDMLKIDTAIAGVGATATGADAKADAAVAAAETASDTASDAATLANTANTNANSALATAGNAATAASAAQTAAATAQSTAESAGTAASAADAKIGDLAQLGTTDKTSLVAAINEVNAKPSGGGTAASISYDNTDSGLTATDVQAAIDELKALIPTTPEYITTGLSVRDARCVINDGGYYIKNDICYVDITYTVQTAITAGNAVMVDGFPAANVAASAEADITAVFNNALIHHYANGDATSLVQTPTTAAGTAVHFIGSYQIRTT